MALKIYLSPSSQSSNPYSAGGTNEQRQCNRIAEAAKIALERNGYIVKKAPEGQGYVQNAAESNAWGADIHMPIHTNAGGSSKGTMGLCYQGCATNKYMQNVYKAVADLTPWPDSGIIVRSDLYEINSTKAMCVYIEMAFHDKVDSAKWIIDNVVPLGEAIAKGMCAADGKTYISGDGTEVVPPMDTSGGSTTESTSSKTIHFKYKVRTKQDGWLPEVVNLADYAGIKGHAITDVAIGVDQGSLWYQVHVKGGGWLPAVTGYNTGDYNNGYAGNGKPIDAVRVYYNTPADYIKKYGYQKAQYRVSPLNGSYWPWQYDNETGSGQDGYAGVFGRTIDKFQLF